MEFVVDMGELKRLRDVRGRANLVWMKPMEFLAQVPDTQIDCPNLRDLEQKIRAGTPLDPPFLDKDCEGKVVNHEGRHRALAAWEMGVTRLPVLVFDKCPAYTAWKLTRLEQPLSTEP